MAYLNANATTPMYKAAAKLIGKLYRQAINVHADDKLAKSAAQNIQEFQAHVHTTFGYNSLFVSCASEANTMAMQSFATIHPTGTVVSTSTEHSGMLLSIEFSKVSIVYIRPVGKVYNTLCPFLENIPVDKPVFVCVMHGNNETGYINDVVAIAQSIKKKRPNTHIHVDASQTFCKIFTNRAMYDAGIDTVTVSFHKIRGPHLGMLLFADKAKLRPLIQGTQQGGLRGGTLSAPIISAAYYAYMRNMQNNTTYQAQLQHHRMAILQQLQASPIKVIDVDAAKVSPDTWLQSRPDGSMFDAYAEYHIQIFGLNGADVLANTILLVVYDPHGRFCNIECKAHLDTHDIIIGIGSACLTNKQTASHIADVYNLNKLQKRGLLRLSFTPKLKNCEYAIGMLLAYLTKFI